MIPPYNFYWFRIDNKHMTEPWLDQALMDLAYRSEITIRIFFLYDWFFSFTLVFLLTWYQRHWFFATNSNFHIPISLRPDGVNLWYFKLRLFNLLVFIVWNWVANWFGKAGSHECNFKIEINPVFEVSSLTLCLNYFKKGGAARVWVPPLPIPLNVPLPL